jgi:hypothetical protein
MNKNQISERLSGFQLHTSCIMLHSLRFRYIASSKAHKMSEPRPASIFSKENYTWMLAGLVVMAIGMFLLAGGRNTDPAVFDTTKVYSPTRITVAPILILAGLVIEIFAIFRKSKSVG